jgi:hypothetical protein
MNYSFNYRSKIKMEPSKYYELTSENPNRMLLFNIVKHSPGESWTMGRRFKKAPKLPVIARIQPDNENSELLPFFNTPPLMSIEFYEAMLEASVNNLDVYDAIIRSEDGSIEYKFKKQVKKRYAKDLVVCKVKILSRQI